jgi:hypothetical protein
MQVLPALVLRACNRVWSRFALLAERESISAGARLALGPSRPCRRPTSVETRAQITSRSGIFARGCVATLLALHALGFVAPRPATAECVHPQGNIPFELFGDVNDSGAVNVADALCVVLVALWQLDEPSDPAPQCLLVDLVLGDLDCGGAVNVADAQLAIYLSIANALPESVDGDGDGCTDTCSGCVGPAETSCLIAGACVAGNLQHPTDPCLACLPNSNPAGWSVRPDGSSCGPGLQCVSGECEVFNGGQIPLSLIATAGNGEVSLSWLTPGALAGLVTQYVVRVYAPGGGLATGVAGGAVRFSGSAATNFVFTGLTNGVAYVFSVQAETSTLTGPESALSNTVIPNGPPLAPLAVTAAPGDSSAVVSFLPPSSNNGSPITGYRVFVWPGGSFVNSVSSPTLVAGLVNGQSYFFTVAAINAAGLGPQSLPSNSVIPLALPAAPTILAASGQNGQVALHVLPPAYKGGAETVTFFAICTSTDGTSTGTGASATDVVWVTGLTNGKPHMCQAAAVNAAGQGPYSAPTGLVVPNPLLPAPGALVARPVAVLGADLATGPQTASRDGVLTHSAPFTTLALYSPPQSNPPSGALSAAAAPFVTNSTYASDLSQVGPTGALVASAPFVTTFQYSPPAATQPASGALVATAPFVTTAQFSPAIAADPASGALVASAPFVTTATFSGAVSAEPPSSALVAAAAPFVTQVLYSGAQSAPPSGALVSSAATIATTVVYDGGFAPVRRGAVVAAPSTALGRPLVQNTIPGAVSSLVSSVVLTIEGVGLHAVSNVQFYGPNGLLNTELSASAPVLSPDGESLTVNVTIAPTADLGTWTVVVVTGSGIASVVAPPAGQQNYDNTLVVN